MEHLFLKSSFLDTCYSKETGAIDPEPKWMEYFIFCAQAFCIITAIWLASRSLKSAYLGNMGQS